MLRNRYIARVWVLEYAGDGGWHTGAGGTAAQMLALAAEMHKRGHRARVRFMGVAR